MKTQWLKTHLNKYPKLLKQNYEKQKFLPGKNQSAYDINISTTDVCKLAVDIFILNIKKRINFKQINLN